MVQINMEPIPGLKKDYEEDFKTALLRARGIIKWKRKEMKKSITCVRFRVSARLCL